MNLKVTESEQFERQLPTAGMCAAAISSIIDLGTQDSEFGPKRKLEFTYELAEKAIFNPENGEQPFHLSKRETASMNTKSNLYDIVQSLIGSVGEDFNPYELLGKQCLLNLVHVVKGDVTYCNIASISPMMAGVEPVELVNYPVSLELDAEAFSEKDFELLPEWKQTLIKASAEYKALAL
jgi:hypothetical protein